MPELFQGVEGLVIIGLLTAIITLLYNRRTSYLGALKTFDPNKEVTTVSPVSIHAATCQHKWEVVVDKLLDMDHEKKQIIVLECSHCGSLDKTVQVTSPRPKLPPPPKEACNHEWITEHQQLLDMPHEKKTVLVLKCNKCGVLDKTIEVTSTPAWTKEQCRHKWDIEKKVVLDSAYEQMLESIKVKAGYNGSKKIDPNKALDLDLNKCPEWMFKKTYVSIRTCTVCGEVDKTVASNFEAEKPEEVENE